MVRKINIKHSRKRMRIAGMVAIILLVLVCIFAYKVTRTESPDVVQGRLSKEVPKPDPSSDSTGLDSNQNSTNSVETSVPPAGSAPAQVQPNNLPTPVLAKSSGNNGSIPPDVTVNLTCESAPGYFCEVKLEKAGVNTVTLEKKQLTGERGQSFASWNWESISGTWSVTAVLSNSSGQSKSSVSQNLEVR